MADQKEKVIVIIGPTGVGKTALSIELAKQYDAEIISGDSIQVYRKLNIRKNIMSGNFSGDAES